MTDAEHAFRIGATLNESFDAAVSAHPEKIALENHGSSLTYRELQRQANCIASVALDTGISRGDRVFVLNRNALLSSAVILALGKVVAVGVQANPGDPPELLRAILEDSGARLIMVARQHQELAHALARGEMPTVVIDTELFSGEPRISNRANPEDRAWIAYTSGSTGRPKGVTHTVRSVMSFLAGYIERTGLGSSDRVARLHETRGMDMLSALLVGASSHVFDLGARGFTGIGQWLGEHRITVVPTVPTVFRYIVQELRLRPADLAVRLLRLSGEPLARQDLLQAAAVFPESCEILNWYGSTEVAVASRTYSFADLEKVSAIPAGRVFDDLEVEIVDDNGDPVAGSRIGEITVKGDALFEGYWNRPELNAVALSGVDDGSNRRRFSTGDTGFIDAAGELTICGRKDEQIKVSGFRVEPGEIEAALRALPGISDAAIVPCEGKLGNDPTTELAAYLSFDGSVPPTVEMLRDRLRGVLPRYKVPAYFVRVEAIPKLGSGKTDKRSLPAFVPVTRLDYNALNDMARPGGESD